MSPGQYARFMLAGTFTGLITVAARELISVVLGADNPRNYSLSVTLAYAIGIVVSFLVNHRFTFNDAPRAGRWSRFAPFVAIAVLGLVSTWALSLALRYGLHLDERIGSWAERVAFVAAVLMTTVLTYPLNALWVFGRPRLRDTPPAGA